MNEIGESENDMTVHEKLDKLISGNAFLGTILNEYTSNGAYTTGFTMNTPSDKEEFFLVMCYGQSINENVHASFSGSGYKSSTRILYLQSPILSNIIRIKMQHIQILDCYMHSLELLLNY